MMTTTLQVVGEPQASPLPHLPDAVRAVVRVTDTPDEATARLGFRTRVSFGIARRARPGEPWVCRETWRTLAKAREVFAGRRYP